MKEIFGVDQRLLATVGSVGADTMSLTGVPASSGVARGRARVIVEVTDLGDLEPDEILVCVFTSPELDPGVRPDRRLRVRHRRRALAHGDRAPVSTASPPCALPARRRS